MATRSARTAWNGSLSEGAGQVELSSSRVGTFDALCNEVCGVSHYAMRGRVVVDAEPDYAAWLQRQRTFAQLPAGRGQRRVAAQQTAPSDR